ncbi:hypothetical protein LptCag_1017 [Leptospirillum ferriphilum]|uniref:Uncharacterized protein n=1 Tax=Leptospirillum ferriphilum TaxID=178606 RepID=A0A094X6R4_9BACT|nr:hypothetical protein LptCag_1017 [Leptospirillum ferriphilum]
MPTNPVDLSLADQFLSGHHSDRLKRSPGREASVPRPLKPAQYPECTFVPVHEIELPTALLPGFGESGVTPPGETMAPDSGNPRKHYFFVENSASRYASTG